MNSTRLYDSFEHLRAQHYLLDCALLLNTMLEINGTFCLQTRGKCAFHNKISIYWTLRVKLNKAFIKHHNFFLLQSWSKYQITVKMTLFFALAWGSNYSVCKGLKCFKDQQVFETFYLLNTVQSGSSKFQSMKICVSTDQWNKVLCLQEILPNESICNVNKIGPKTNPWGTPQLMGCWRSPSSVDTCVFVKLKMNLWRTEYCIWS